MEERTFVIGDIHGCRTHLERMLNILPLRPQGDRLIFIGDYIDRGPDSKGVVEIILEIIQTYPQTVCLMGNHELMLLDYLEGGDPMIYLYNGGQTTLNSYGYRRGLDLHEAIGKQHIDFYRNLLPYLESEDYIFVHAGFRPNLPLERQVIMDLVWIREQFYNSKVRFDKTVIFGHTPFAEPLVLPDRIGIDTGAVYGNKLTCLQLPDRTFYQV